jgi:AbrB family looped-hinge helix DNA binding protein
MLLHWTLTVNNLEEFVTRVYTDSRITVPVQIRKRFEIKNGDYLRLILVEVLKKTETGKWVKKKVE